MNIAVLGCGNMASAIVKCMAEADKTLRFHTYTPTFTKADILASEVGGISYKNLKDIEEADYWLIACKPQQFDDLCKSLGDKLKNKNVISIMAAISEKSISEKLGTDKVIRIMPNTPSKFGQGISLLYTNVELPDELKGQVKKLFEHCGDVFVLSDEKGFDSLTLISGSGPAYVYLFAKIYSDLASEFGLDKSSAKKLVTQLFKGSSILMEKDTSSFQQMIDAVTSKGGVTIEAVNSLKADGLEQIIRNSINMADKRSKDLTDSFN